MYEKCLCTDALFFFSSIFKNNYKGIIYLYLTQKFPDIDAHVKNPEEEFDKLKEELEAKGDDGSEHETTTNGEEVKKKVSSTPKVSIYF